MFGMGLRRAVNRALSATLAIPCEEISTEGSEGNEEILRVVFKTPDIPLLPSLPSV
jgi:hypothetical protein